MCDLGARFGELLGCIGAVHEIAKMFYCVRARMRRMRCGSSRIGEELWPLKSLVSWRIIAIG